MKITQITYGETINLGNYQSARVDFTADIENGDDNRALWDQLMSLKSKVEEAAKDIKRDKGVK